jgi:hypothetical protein
MADTQDTLDSEIQKGPTKRTTFVTVLCILSFIAIGTTLLSNLISIATYSVADQEMIAEMMEDSMDQMGDSAGSGFLESIFSTSMEAMEYQIPLAIVSIIAQLFCLFGCLQMWKMKKMGFYLYLVGEWAPAIVTMVLLGAFFGIIGAIVPIIFSVLYGLNVKDMD